MNISNATAQNVQEMLTLDYKFFSHEWHLSDKWVKEIIRKYPEIYCVITVEGRVKGYYCFYPLSKEPYEKLLAGDIHEMDLISYVLDYSTPCEIYLYLFSIIVDINDSLHKQYTRHLIQDIPNTLKKITDKGMTINEIGAIAISEDGVRILKRMGLSFSIDLSSKMRTRFLVYRSTVSNLTIVND